MKSIFWFMYCLTCYFKYLKKKRKGKTSFSSKKKYAKLIVSWENGRFFTIHRAAPVSSSKAIKNCLLAATNTPMRLIIAWWLWFSLVKIKATRLLRQSTCVPLRPIRIQEINSRGISLATLGHVVQIAKWASRNCFRLHRYLSCLRKETRSPEKKKEKKNLPWDRYFIFVFKFRWLRWKGTG